jgi:hypothetical protein
MKGMSRAMIVMKGMFVVRGRFAMCKTAAATSDAGIVGSTFTDPSG